MVDPKLIQAARDVFAAQQKDASLSPAELDAFVKQETGGKYGFEHVQKLISGMRGDHGNGVASFLQGFTGNFGDELVGLMPSAIGGGEEGKQSMRLRGDLFHKDHKALDTLLGVTGGVTSAALLPETKLLSTGSQVMRGARVGAAYGAVNGLGAGENAKERAMKGGAGLVTGAALGAAIPSVVAGVKNITDPARRGIAHLVDAVEGMGGFSAAHDANITLGNAGKGDITRFADLSPETNALADFAATNSDKSRIAIKKVVDRRKAFAPSRVINDFKDAQGGDVHAPTIKTNLENSLRKWAKPLYDKLAADNPGPMNNAEAIKPLLKDPKIKPFWDKIIGLETSRASVSGEGVGSNVMDTPEFQKMMGDAPGVPRHVWEAVASDPEQIQGLRNIGKLPPLEAGSESQTFSNFKQLKEDLEDAASKAFRAGENNLGHTLKAAHDVVHDTMNQVPGYASLTKQYARRMDVVRALQTGIEAWHSNDITGMKNTVASLAKNPAALFHFRKGLASEIILSLQGKGTGAAAVREVTAGSEATQAQLKEAFGSKQTFNDFMLRAKAEKQLGGLESAVSGSPTARRLATAAADPLNEAHMFSSPHGGSIPHKLIRLGVKHTVGRIQRNTAAQLEAPLLTKGTGDITSFLSKLEAGRSPLLGKKVTDYVPAAIGSLFGFGHN